MEKATVPKGFTKALKTILCDARTLSALLDKKQPGGDRVIPYELLEAIFRIHLSEDRRYAGMIRELAGLGFLRIQEDRLVVISDRVERLDTYLLPGDTLGTPPIHWMKNLIAHWRTGVRIFSTDNAMLAPGEKPKSTSDVTPNVKRPRYKRWRRAHPPVPSV